MVQEFKKEQDKESESVLPTLSGFMPVTPGGFPVETHESVKPSAPPLPQQHNNHGGSSSKQDAKNAHDNTNMSPAPPHAFGDDGGGEVETTPFLGSLTRINTMAGL